MTKNDLSLICISYTHTTNGTVSNFEDSFMKKASCNNYYQNKNVGDLSNVPWNVSDSYSFIDDTSEKLDIIFTLTKKLYEESQNIDSKFVEIVNNHFWELI